MKTTKELKAEIAELTGQLTVASDVEANTAEAKIADIDSQIASLMKQKKAYLSEMPFSYGSEETIESDVFDDVDDLFEEDLFEASASESQEHEENLGEAYGLTQDYLEEVQDEANSSVPTQDAYLANLKEAATRLDKLATSVEAEGNGKLAFELDTIADEVDAKIASIEAE